jgi:hypothetical protein
MARSEKKLVDSSSTVSDGGRAQRYWKGMSIQRSRRYSTNRLDFNVDQSEIIKNIP